MAVRFGNDGRLQSVPDNQKQTTSDKLSGTPLGNAINKSRRSGGGSSSNQQSTIESLARQRAAEEQARINELVKAEALKRELATRQAEAEKIRIENLRKAIIAKGAQERQQTLRTAEGERIRTTTTEIRKIINGVSTNVLVYKYENLDSGEVRYRSYEGPGRRKIGGVDINQQSASDIKNIKSELINAGLKPIIKNGQVIGFSSSDTRKSYSYTDAGINAYNRDSKSSGAQFRKIIRDKKENGMSYSPAEQSKIRSLSTKWTNKINNLSEDIRQSARNKEISRLADLQRKKNLSSAERIEKARLQKKVADNYQKVSKIIGLSLANSVLSLGIGSFDLANALIRNPIKTLKGLPGNVGRAILQDAKRFIKDPLETLIVVSEYAALGGTFKVIGIGSKATLRTVSKISPKYVRSVKGGFIIRNAPKESFKVSGKTRFLKTRVLKPSIKRPFSSVINFLQRRKPGQFKKFTKDPGLILKKQTVKSGSSSLAKQTRLAGREITAVNAAADQLTSWIRRRKIIRKPIPGEANFPTKIKNILNKFDSGKRLTTREFAEVNLWLQKNVAPNITLLERSLYADPASGLRVSRLGIQPEKTAGIRDILRGNFRLFGGSSKPQVLIFENAKVARFPRTLKIIERKLKSGRTLTTAETNKLIRWQVQTGSGKFKPIGSTIYAGGRELEVTLAPGEMIRRIKKVGFTYINKKKVTFVTAEVFNPGRAILRKISLANAGKLSSSGLKRLENFLSRKLGRRIRIETPSRISKNLKRDIRMARRMDPNIPVLRIRGRGLFALSRKGFLNNRLLSRNPIKRVTSIRVNPKRNGRINRNIKRVNISRGRTNKRINSPRTSRRNTLRNQRIIPRKGTQRRTMPRRIIINRPGKPKPPIPKILRSKPQFFRSNLSRAQPTYYVVEKVRGKFKKLYPKPLTQKDARDFAVYSIDNHLSKTAFFVPLGKAKRIVRPPRQIQNYAARNSFKVRPYRIRFGKKRQLVNGFIEKRRFFRDTRGERGQLANLKRLQSSRNSRNRVVSRRTIRRKITPTQRKVLLKRLEMARRVRMRNLRKR